MLCTPLLESLPVKVEANATGPFKAPGSETREFPSSTQSHSSSPALASFRGFLLTAWPNQLGPWGGIATPAQSVALQECMSRVPLVGGCEEEGVF